MFHNYSFQAASRHPSQPCVNPYPSVSPTSTPESYTTTHHALNDITRQLETSHLSESTSPSYFDIDTTSSYNPSANTSPTSAHAPYDPFPSPSATYLDTDFRALRAQRQASARLQCNTRHLREISALVARMVESGEQCSLQSPSSSSSIVDPSEVVEFNGSEGQPSRNGSVAAPSSGESGKLKYRRSCDFAHLDGCVARNVRVRKRRPKSGSAVSKS